MLVNLDITIEHGIQTTILGIPWIHYPINELISKLLIGVGPFSNEQLDVSILHIQEQIGHHNAIRCD